MPFILYYTNMITCNSSEKRALYNSICIISPKNGNVDPISNRISTIRCQQYGLPGRRHHKMLDDPFNPMPLHIVAAIAAQ